MVPVLKGTYVIDTNPLENSLLETIGKSAGYEILSDVGELAIDEALKTGVLKEIPVIKTLTSLVNGVVSVKEYIFAKKVLRFLTRVRSVPNHELDDFLAKLEQEPDQKRRLGETLFLILDRLDNMDKSEYVARSFKALVRGQITFDMFLRFLTSIDRAFIPDLLILHNNQDPKTFSSSTNLSLANSGLLQSHSVWGGDIFGITEVGNLFVKFVLHDNY